MSTAKVHNHVLNHVALSVPNVEEAVKWYEDVFGFKRIRIDKTTDRDVVPDAAIFRIYGQQLKKVKVAYCSAGNGVGIEFFEFIDPAYKKPEKEFDYNRGGIYHIAVTVPDANEALQRAIAAGGKQIGETVDVSGEQAFYVLDPWGNAVECLTTSFEKLLANRS